MESKWSSQSATITDRNKALKVLSDECNSLKIALMNKTNEMAKLEQDLNSQHLSLKMKLEQELKITFLKVQEKENEKVQQKAELKSKHKIKKIALRKDIETNKI